ncbi:MAG: 50S ribosomal protein L11 methyltransferase, partial [Leptolyngbyaceae cyanobacterium]
IAMMSWLELRVDTTQEGVDWVRTLLATESFSGEMLLAPYPDDSEQVTDSNWEFTLSWYLPYNSEARRQVDAIAHQLAALQRTGLTTELQVSVVEQPTDIGKPVAHAIGQRFVILEPGVDYPGKDNQILLRLQPSLAFGSGLHPATRLSLQLLEQHIKPGMQALDLGCGSGILSVAMAKLGALVLAVDNDPIAVDATQTAVRANGVEAQVIVLQGSLGAGRQLGHWMGGEAGEDLAALPVTPQFDLIAANILARVHVALAQDYRQTLKQSGLLVSAGYTTDHAADVAIALTEVGFTAIDEIRFDEWVAVVYQVRESMG